MSLQTWQEALTTQHGAGTSFGSFTTAKSVIPPQALVTLPPGFWLPGKRMRISLSGGIGNLVTTPGTITFQVMLGSVVVFTSGAIQLNASAHVNIPFNIVIDLTCRAEGNSTSANLMGQGVLIGKQFTLTAGQTDATNVPGAFMLPATAPAVGTGFDSTVANILDFWAGFSISDAANTIKIEQYLVEALN